MPQFLDHLPDATAPDLADTLDRLAGFGAALARRIARGGLDEALGTAQGSNADGDTQKALDVIADDMTRASLAGGAVRYYASEEQHEVMTLGAGTLALVIDPLDGSSNIDTNVSVGTIFGLYPAADTPEASVLRPSRELLAAGYMIYGPQCCLMLRVGAGGVLKYVLDPDAGRFRSLGEIAEIPADSSEYAINASNYRHWPDPIRAYIDDRVAGTEGPMGHDFNMRWIASLVAEAHRILTRGGIFLYPGDRRKGYEQGRLRLVYECGPIAHLIEGVGGRASDGTLPIRDRQPRSLHARAPFVFGSAGKVARVATYHDLPEAEVSALFGSRGLFRT
ncbi:MAG: class 1 fructose-bisphosphatase [Alphaproteobacteria bacterium HGW-Alphaproteobacteria-1]|nr:MAG: class 1 fructose-bisphosphatase [Alphaproteobacteria bacterium HGW-Alphaproteobacteria-1]